MNMGRVPRGARGNRDAWLDPEILLAGRSPRAAEQECRFLPLARVIPGPSTGRSLPAQNQKTPGLAELGDFCSGNERRHAVDELRAVEEADRSGHAARSKMSVAAAPSGRRRENFQHVAPIVPSAHVREQPAW